MPGNFTKGNTLNAQPAPIHSQLKSKRRVYEAEKPTRWSFYKVLRESNFRHFYPEINPYTEVYQLRENTWVFYNDSFDGAGDVWMFLIDGPKKALLVDTSFGIGDLKSLVRKFIGDKELIVVNTHAHYDHCYGDEQFGKVYCHEREVPDLQSKNNPDIWDYLFNQTDHDIEVWGQTVHPGEPIYTWFDRKDVIVDLDHKETFRPFTIIGVPDHYEFDLGDGYIVEAVPLPGHTPGMCAYWDHHNNIIYSGDDTGMGNRPKGTPYGEYCTVEAMHDALAELLPRLSGDVRVCSGHGPLDQSCIVLQYLYETTQRIMEDPDHPDKKQVHIVNGQEQVSCLRLIEQWGSMRYSPQRVFKKQFLEEK